MFLVPIIAGRLVRNLGKTLGFFVCLLYIFIKKT